MSKRSQKPQKLFAAVDPAFGPRFAFNAKSTEQATDLINAWNRYHSFNDKDTANTVREIQESDLAGLQISIHNEYTS